MSFVDLIAKKRDGFALSREEIDGFVDGVVSSNVPDYQAAALLMAIVLRGMSAEETAWLTDAMVRSGERVDLSDIPGPKVGKHSTGGVGDKVSIALVPLAAACGVVVPKMSGRGLGHTGGTVDKLESIPGYRADLTIEEFKNVLRRVGGSIIGQTASLARADKKIYALRDVTATVASIPLIASSIMSKKIAEGCAALVLDVKTGDGAFMKELDGAKALASAMTAIGTHAGIRTEAVVTDMDAPLGRAVGNALEIVECIETLKGTGPPDVVELLRAMATRMVLLAGIETGEAAATRRVEGALHSGRALETLGRMIEAHGGNPAVVDDYTLLPAVRTHDVIGASRSGFVMRLAAGAIGRASHALGAGRVVAGAAIDHAVGVIAVAKPGDQVGLGQSLVEIHHRDRRGLEDARALCREAITIGDAPPVLRPSVIDAVPLSEARGYR
jgi:pyrimidine-nucleoside phosphorylase